MSTVSLFDGMYKELWRRIVPEALTQAELGFLIDILAVNPGDRVLDAMCGYGRHSLGLAEKGMAVTAVDSAAEYITEIQEKAGELPIEAITSTVESFRPSHQYQAAICMGNSISSLNRQQTLDFFKTLNDCLEPGGRFVLNTWMLTEIVVKKYRDREWYQVKEFKYLLENEYLLQPTRMETIHTVIAPDGAMEQRTDTDYIFSIAEMEALLNESGFDLVELYSTPRKRIYSLGDEYAYFLAQKK